MAYEAVFKVETKLEATDYRKFLYISMFKKNKLAIPIVLGISLIFGVMSSHNIEASNKMEYSKFYQVLESRNYFMFYINSSMAHILRKEDLKGIDMNTFRNFLQEKFEGNFKRI